MYQATSIEPPPPASITLSAAKVFPYEDNTEKSDKETLRIDDGYAALVARAIATWTTNDDTEGGMGPTPGNSFINLVVGGVQLRFGWNNAIKTGNRFAVQSISENLNPANPNQPVEERTISYVFGSNLVNAMTLNLEITCVRTPELFAKWQLQTYDKIIARWEKLHDEYLAKVAVAKQEKRRAAALAAKRSGGESPNRTHRAQSEAALRY